MVNREIPFGHDLLQIAVRQGISQVPANAQKNDLVFEMPPTEECGPSSGHDTPYQISSICVCNRTLNPDSTIKNLGGYTVISSTTGTGREGIDERPFRVGLRITF
jgi:hypothetical protein